MNTISPVIQWYISNVVGEVVLGFKPSNNDKSTIYPKSGWLEGKPEGDSVLMYLHPLCILIIEVCLKVILL